MTGKGENSPQFPYILSDHWLDRDAKLHFDFEGLAKTLAELAWNPANDTPFTVVVRGGWGRGKTTLMRRTQSLLDGKETPNGARKVTTLWFNAWKYSNEDSVLSGLLGTLLGEFQRGDLTDQLKGFLVHNKGTLIQRLLRVAAPWIRDDKKLGALFDSNPVDAAEYGLIEEKRAFHDTFRGLFSRLSHLLLFSSDLVRDKRHIPESKLWPSMDQKKGSLAIFLDDLDRCPDKRILETLEAINLFLDLPGVCFYLGLDWERLAHILHKHFGDRTDEFLEKIVQISLELPEINQQDAGDYIAELVGSHPMLQETLSAEDAPIVAGLLASRHPRHVKRFLNDLSMRLAVLNNTNHLGPESPQLPTASVLAWHLLHEALPEFAQKTAKLRANLDAFLRNWSETRANLKEDKMPENLDEGLRKAHEQGQLDPFIARLEDLERKQREALVHFGSPPEDQLKKVSRKARRTGIGKLNWLKIKAGTFEIGSEEWNQSQPVHKIQITNDFFVAKYPITNAQYKDYVDASDANPPEHWDGGEIPEGKADHPVVHVSWEDAMAYCDWLNRRRDEQDGSKVRLPTEAEWEYVASGMRGQKRRFPWGNPGPDDSFANFMNKVGETTPVGVYPKGATPYGVLDMAGNVWEWCLDAYDSKFYAASPEKDPVNLKDRSACVLRGGAFSTLHPDALRTAFRYGDDPSDRDVAVGFRVVLSPFSPIDL